jgi:helix-hairpin-helix protein
MSSNIELIDLNSADRKLLTQLPGVSKDVAYHIVNYRKQHGGFRGWPEVATATGFSRTQMAALKSRAALGPRQVPDVHERRVISRWKGKPEDEQHAHG